MIFLGIIFNGLPQIMFHSLSYLHRYVSKPCSVKSFVLNLYHCMRLVCFIFFYPMSFANCLFSVANYTNYPVKVQVGFYGSESKIINVSNQITKSVNVSNNLDCYGISQSGLGVVYINLIGSKSNGGWRYDPQGGMIRAIGKSRKNGAMTLGVEPNGHDVMLMNNYKPESDGFGVILKPAQFGTSKIGSSN